MTFLFLLVFTNGLTIHSGACDEDSTKLHETYEAIVSDTSVILYTVVLCTLLLDNGVEVTLQVYGFINRVFTGVSKLPSRMIALLGN